MPAGMGEEERFAAAVELGTTPDHVGRGDSLPRDLEMVALLRAAGPALAPDPRAREQARRRLMAAFAEEFAVPRELGRHLHDSVEATGPVPAVAALVALAGSGMFASEDALPGDPM